MSIQIITTSEAKNSNQTTSIQRKPGQTAVKHLVQAGQKITLVIDGERLTGAQPLAGAKVKLVKTDQNLVLQALDSSEEFIELTNFYDEPNVVLTGASWILAEGSQLQAFTDGVVSDVSPVSPTASSITSGVLETRDNKAQFSAALHVTFVKLMS